ncbi:MAG: FAD-binding oxidoreductase [Pigmentiphaga sp.]
MSNPTDHAALSPELVTALEALLGAGSISRDPTLNAGHAGDWSEAPHLQPSLVLLPRTPRQVADVLKLCHDHGRPIAVQGGLTGLTGGATPQRGEIVLSLARLNAIEELDTVGGTVLVQAGVVLEALQQQVETQGWAFPLDLGARGSCQVGGNAATNAGGNRVIRYGTMRNLVLGLEVALPDGRLLDLLGRVTKNTTGVDLKHLFIGAEGTLGVITRLTLKLSPRATATTVALCALPSFNAATQLVRDLRRGLPGLSAFELMWQDFMAASCEVLQLRPPFAEPAPVYALVETQGLDDAADRLQLEQALGQALEQEIVSDVIVAQSIDDNHSLWAYRESVGELLGRLKPFAAFDIAIPVARMGDFVQQVGAELAERYPAPRHLFFGHLGDDNLHLLTGRYPDAADLHAVEAAVYAKVGEYRGSISGEHGVGVVKKTFLHHSRSTEELAIMRQLKAMFDPKGILNPGRILDDESGQAH